MFKIIEKLQRQPKDARRQVGFFVAGVVTLIIFLFWIAAIGSRLDTTLQQRPEEETPEVLTPFETMGESLGRIIENTKEDFSSLGF